MCGLLWSEHVEAQDAWMEVAVKTNAKAAFAVAAFLDLQDIVVELSSCLRSEANFQPGLTVRRSSSTSGELTLHRSMEEGLVRIWDAGEQPVGQSSPSL